MPGAGGPPGGSCSNTFPGLRLASPNSSKKARGRPDGYRKKQQIDNLELRGFGYSQHIIHVKTREDVITKIMSFNQNLSRTVCVLSASGVLSNVTLRHGAPSKGIATYKGSFHIVSLSGSFLLAEIGGQKRRTGVLRVSLAESGGRVLGGCVEGVLIAATPVQVIVHSFVAYGWKEPMPANHFRAPPAPLNAKPPRGLTEFGFTPHIITAEVGEDFASKILTLAQICPKSVCFLSSSDLLSDVSLTLDAASGETVTYKGQFDIVSLSGPRSRAGGFRVLLVGSDGLVFGGPAEDDLIAASPVQVILASFFDHGPPNAYLGGMTTIHSVLSRSIDSRLSGSTRTSKSPKSEWPSKCQR